MFGAFTGLITPFSEIDHFNFISNKLRSEGSQPSDGEDEDVEDRERGKGKGKGKKRKGKRKQHDSKTVTPLEESLSEQTGSHATTPANQSPTDKHTTHKYPPTQGSRSVDAHDDPTIVTQAAKAFKTAVLHDARNIKGTSDVDQGLVFSVNSTHEAKVRIFMLA
jgi:hypothetical protein